ncbi:uncharacterized protein LOC120067584 [Benincasa hispida]|uniref:uncharacterized protein LOC120067584 n=1 Tax=Benincasa hispida TaxID=102211 RepID=UPI001901E9A1|nr:uncharacterized protein LOC120067584 [Benincasa hispida]
MHPVIKDAYDRWTKANEKARVYILASISEILAKKHEVIVTMRKIMESLQEMFGQSSYQLHHDALKYGYLYLMSHKSEDLEKFKEYKVEVENLLGKTVKMLRSDQDGDYIDQRFQEYMIEHGIQS